MRSRQIAIAALFIVAGAACSGESATDQHMSADLQRDLAAAKSSSLELASGRPGYQPMRFVSEIEQVHRAEPVTRRPTPKPRAKEPAGREAEAQQAPQPEAAQTIELTTPDVAESTEQTDSAVVAEAPRVPMVAPRPAPVPVEVPTSGGSRTRGSNGPDWGDAVGVVIRGGRVDPGHCPPRRPPSRIPGIILPQTEGRVPVFRPDAHGPVLRPIIVP